YTRQFFEPIRNLSDQYNTLLSAMAGAERIFGLLDQDYTIKEREHPVEIDRLKGHIEFRNVWFTYQKEFTDGQEPSWILRDVSCTVEAGEQGAIVGATGAGKPSFWSPRLRLSGMEKGGMYIDGIEVRDLRLGGLRRHVGLVLQ